MSTVASKRSLEVALAEAERFKALFPIESYERWEIAGSVRRKKLYVGDIEHVVIPRWGEISIGGGLFPLKEKVNLLWHHLESICCYANHLDKHWYGPSGHRWGPRYRGVDFHGQLHEIFTADYSNWGAILTIRTGPAAFSQRIMSHFNANGMYRQHEGQLICVADGKPVPVPDEASYLRLAGLPYIQPEDRK